MLRRFQQPALVFLALLAILVAARPATAGKIEDLRKAGTVGERFDGYVAIRAKAPAADLKATVDEINAGRKEIYQKRAAEENVPVDQVGRVYARQIYEDSPPGTWFLLESGEWVQK
jgi:hypothetical protein